MCHHCGAQSMESSNCMEKQGNAMESNNGEPVQSCNMCGENKEKVVVKQEDLIPHGIPSISSAVSLKSSDSSISSCSDFSVEPSSCGRGDAEGSGTDSSQEDSGPSLKAHLPNFTVPFQANNKDNKGTGGGDGQEAGDSSESSSCNNETNDEFWLPPDSEDQEDDVVSSFTTYDDDDEDDEYSDSTNWRKTDSLIGFEEEGSGCYKYKEEKKKALDEVMNGRFKALVGQLLRSVGVATSEKAGENWVDIVTSLSWQAASYIKPDNSAGKAMDPDGYVKIKCVATGSRIQSRVIKGLVFKKHAAHKRMPTSYKNPKLLLIQGALDLSSSGLSSLEAMQQEKDSLKPIIGMIEMCHPNVILVEKTVSRDIQESILAKGMTLVLDMKLHRLERVARCVGSPILSSDFSIAQKLRQCDSFHFEKFVEEHAPFDEGGKRPSKTLMFIEGCPTRLGCTILLMGADNDELKRIKYVVRCAVVMAYHFMLETSFLLDQRAMFSTVGAGDATVSSSEESDAAINSSSAIDIPISNGFHEEGPHNLYSVSEGNSLSPFEPYNPIILSGFSSPSNSLKNVMADSLPLFTRSRQSMSNYFSLDEKIPDDEIHNIQIDAPISSSPNVEDHIGEVPKVTSSGEKVPDVEQPHSTSSSCGNPLDTQNSSNRDDISAVLDSESILVLMSSRNASKGIMCEHSHFSHIKFYRNFDVPLGKFLRDNLLNQRLRCKACDEPPEAHFFYYAHHNKQLTIQVKHLGMEKSLPGENEGKLWMWSRCGKCKFHNGSSKSTKRVLISTAARGLSFGKFLELSFSNNSSFDRPSSCGHSFHRDFLNFFGLGPMVAMFKYSPVATYSVSLPPEKLDFSSTITGEYLKKDFEDVYFNGVMMFLDIENSLKELRPRFVGVSLNLQESIKEFSDIEEMLKQERCQFEVDIRNAVQNGNRDEAAYKLLSLNRVRLELLLESCVWDRRLHSLLSSDLLVTDTKAVNHRERQTHLEEDGNAIEEFTGTEVTVETGDNVLEKLVTSVEVNDLPLKEIPIDGDVQGSREQDALYALPSADENTGELIMGGTNENGSSVQDHVAQPDAGVSGLDLSNSQKFKSVQDHVAQPDTGVSGLHLSNSQKVKSPRSLSFKLEHDKLWIWTPFSEILCEYMTDILRGSLPKFGSVTSYAIHTTAHKLITDEGSRLHIPLGTDDYILSDYENEFSSIIACALALLKDLPLANGDLGEDARKEKSFDAKSYENSQILPRLFSLTTPHWSSTSSLDLDAHFQSSTFSEDSHQSSFDGSDHLERLVSLGDIRHPEISMGMVKFSGKRKYSVICLYASHFRQLRNRWCPSEDDYIASLSRCKNWDAKGGKSKSFFAKTLDDRFIIKEIKRTEFDSFEQFAPNYFHYMNQCHENGNQTCLAKILGIYQVILRQPKSGKETRHDLMVMENLSFGRSFARSYDLKGALHARLNTAGNGSGDVLLDQNFVNDMNKSPLYVSRKSKRMLQRGVWNDTTFLKNINVMDYSLLVGVDIHRRELVCGIIDYLRQYTWDKQLETWVKSSLVLPKNQLPTVISPGEYKKRFRKFIDTHFLSVPDHWCSQRSSNPCKLCGLGDYDNSLSTRSQELGELGEHEDNATHGKSQHEDNATHGKSPEEGKQEDDSSHNKSPHERMNGISA